uniref:Uncharacterized protein n=1 Tax=Parascaris univalens TaxID=6257 RepID=A0A915A322_PARUN
MRLTQETAQCCRSRLLQPCKFWTFEKLLNILYHLQLLNEVTNKYECVLSISMFCNKLCSCARFAIGADDRFAIHYQLQLS